MLGRDQDVRIRVLGHELELGVVVEEKEIAVPYGANTANQTTRRNTTNAAPGVTNDVRSGTTLSLRTLRLIDRLYDAASLEWHTSYAFALYASGALAQETSRTPAQRPIAESAERIARHKKMVRMMTRSHFNRAAMIWTDDLPNPPSVEAKA